MAKRRISFQAGAWLINVHASVSYDKQEGCYGTFLIGGFGIPLIQPREV